MIVLSLILPSLAMQGHLLILQMSTPSPREVRCLARAMQPVRGAQPAVLPLTRKVLSLSCPSLPFYRWGNGGPRRRGAGWAPQGQQLQRQVGEKTDRCEFPEGRVCGPQAALVWGRSLGND